MSHTALANAELAIMELLWDDDRLTARSIRERLYSKTPGAQHGTVQRLLQRLEDKGFVERDRELSVHLFSARISRAEYAADQLETLADKLTGGSIAPLITHLMDQKKISRAEIMRLRRILGKTGRRVMTNLVLQYGLSNLALSFVLAVIAWAVHRTGSRPFVAHLLWLLVLAKLVTPPLFSVPVLPAPVATAVAPPSGAPLEAVPVGAFDAALVAPAAISIPAAPAISPTLLETMPTALLVLWALGSAAVLAWSLVRIRRFHRFLIMASDAAPPDVQRLARDLAPRLGLRTCPMVCTTTAQVSPMVWWVGGRVRIVLPAALHSAMPADELRWILAHELAHVRRGDHLVRWLEWLACVGFWWNPVAWWARRNLRINEELCCDALVLSRLRPGARTYAHALMTVVEYLAAPALRPPAVASELNSGGFLERRFRMIVSNVPLPAPQRWLRTTIVACAAGLLPLGLAAVDAAPAEREADRQPAEATDTYLDILSDFVASGAMDGKMAYELYLASMEAKKQQLVAAGEITAEAFDARVGMALRSALFSAELRQAVAAGNLTEEEAAGKLEWMQREMASARDRDRAMRADFERVATELRTMVAAGQISEEDARARLDGLRQAIAERQGERDEHAARDDDMQRRIVGALAEAGIEREAIGNIVGAMDRIVAELKAEGDAFELDAGMQTYLVKQGLTDEQIVLVVGLARRVAQAKVERAGRHAADRADIERRIEGAVERGLMTRAEADAKYAALRQKTAESRTGKMDWAAVEKRIEGAVERGLMTRAEADAKYAALRQKTAEPRHDGMNWRAIEKRIEGAVERGEMTREEADAVYTQIKARMAGPRDR